MLTVELLIAPLRLLITALGTGVLPAGNPADQVRTTTANLTHTRERSAASVRGLGDGWRGEGGDAARRATINTQNRNTALRNDGVEFSRIVEDASRKVKVASTALNTLVDSFERIATALGPQLYTPAGLATILPVAIDHVTRGMEIVGRARHELKADTTKMLALARHVAPAEVAPPGDRITNDRTTNNDHPGGRIPITLPDGSTAYAPNERAAKAVRAALSQRGVRYQWGGTTPDGFDCSGLTQWAYRQAGLELPRLAQDQDTAGVQVSQADLQPGDLAVWSGHVAMYIGNGQMVEAGNPVQVSAVRTTNMSQTFEGFYRPR
ncbi:C40 family peptidase [Gordonia sp. ABSL49_1]|uniref:C40 family peptidase n=1 Tax=unclassified Gordonia (in: high G+C Gram-positive bacteria) TaxID=2657482 RepID=UPI001F0DE053|nr:C40 family peptidase [Gordonia sp. ABSL49_1]MCH5643578.1 C40 family peptidase [Gordonia sp. ABSL49_1]